MPREAGPPLQLEPAGAEGSQPLCNCRFPRGPGTAALAHLPRELSTLGRSCCDHPRSGESPPARASLHSPFPTCPACRPLAGLALWPALSRAARARGCRHSPVLCSSRAPSLTRCLPLFLGEGLGPRAG